jgi:hypothetical protein
VLAADDDDRVSKPMSTFSALYLCLVFFSFVEALLFIPLSFSLFSCCN